jgi:hypothetical protein
MLPILVGRVEGLPEELDALVLTSDLQGVAPSWRNGGANALLGVEVAEVLRGLTETPPPGRGVLPYPERTGVILAGDLYSAPGGDVRGATGDVREVWYAFAESFRWVAGVLGNHDQFGTLRERRSLEAHAAVRLLEGSVTQVDGLCLGGVGEIVGDPRKAGRKSADDFTAALELVLEVQPDILVLHEGPPGGADQPGNSDIAATLRARLDSSRTPWSGVVVCGHSHWEEPLAELRGGVQVLNVDARVVVLVR